MPTIDRGLIIQIEARLKEIKDLLDAGADPAELTAEAQQIIASGVPIVAHGTVAAAPAPEPAAEAEEPVHPPVEAAAEAEAGAGVEGMPVPVTGQRVPETVSLPEPAWSQNEPDGVSPGEPALARDHATDCGWQCAAMAIYATRGIEIPESVAEGYGKGQNAQNGLSTPQEIAAYLAGPHCHLPAEVDAQPWPHQMATITTQLAQGYPVLVLGAWYGPGTAHWVLAEGYTPDGLAYHDPWPTDPAERSRSIAWRDLEAITGPLGGAMVLVKAEARYT